MDMKSIVRWPPQGCLAALILAVVACGGNGPTSRLTQETVLVHWGVPPTVVSAAPYLADQWGYFKQEGIQTEYITTQSGVTLTQAALAGDIDFISSAIEIPMQTAEAGQAMRTVVGVNNKQALALMVPVNSSVSTLQDLKGKRIGIAAIGSAQHSTMKVLLITNGMDANSVTYIPVGVGTAAVAALKAGQIDALLSSDPAIQLLTLSSSPAGKIVVDMRKGAGGVAATPGVAVTVSLSYIDKKPDVVHRVVRAMAKALKRAHDHPDQAFAVYKDLPIFKGIDPAILLDAVNTNVVNYTPVVTQADITAVNNKLLIGGILRLSHQYDQVVATQFIPDWDVKY